MSNKPGVDHAIRLGAWVLPLYLWSAFDWAVSVGYLVFLWIQLTVVRVEPAAIGVEWVIWGGAQLALTVVVAVIAIVRATKVAPGTRGRARTLVVAITSLVALVFWSAADSVLAIAMRDQGATALMGALSLPEDLRPSPIEALQTLTMAQGTWPLLVGTLGVAVVATIARRVFTIAGWFLLKKKIRAFIWRYVDVTLATACLLVTLFFPLRPVEGADIVTTTFTPFEVYLWLMVLPAIRIAITVLAGFRLLRRLSPYAADGVDWIALHLKLVLPGESVFERDDPSGRITDALGAIFDVLVLAAFVVVTLLLPLEPSIAAPQVADSTYPWIRLGVTSLAAIRLTFRTLPIALNILEWIGFRLRVAARMLRARKSGFLTAIGALSILAVSFSSCTLTTTLSVMGGFRDDLKRKILGNNAHVVIDREHGTIDDWEPTLARVRAQDGVVAATPYVGGEVMITSATNLSGAILRGIDPESIGSVTDLPRNMRSGRLDYLVHPDRLLHLSSDELGRGYAPPHQTDDGEPPPLDPDQGSLLDDIDSAVHESGPTDPETLRIRREIEEILGPPPPREGSSPSRDVLPGLILGQELARTLRLHLGDEVNIVSPLGELGPTGPIPKTRAFRVAGIFYSGMYEYDMKMAYTTLEDAQRFLGTHEAISGIEIKVDDVDRAEERAQAISHAIARRPLRVRAWQEVNRNLFGALALEKLAMFITLGIAILVASFCIVATLTLMVQEKGREVGILKAMGATGEQIVSIFMAQGFLIGLLGAAVGLGMGYVACFAAENFGIYMNPEVYYIDRLPVHVDQTEFVLVGVAAVVVALLATVYPAILGSRLQPTDALRYT